MEELPAADPPPHLILPKSDWYDLFQSEKLGFAWFYQFLLETVESPYLLEGDMQMGWMWKQTEEWRQAVCARALEAGRILLSKSEWIE